MKILIIDDEPDTITFLSAWLEDQGYETCFATDGEHGLQTILAEHPDVVLLDIKMPNQTGLQLYRELKRNKALQQLPVIFITGMTEYQIWGDGCEPLPLPAARIGKPFDLKALEEAILTAVGTGTMAASVGGGSDV